VRVVTGKTSEEVDAETWSERCASYASVLVDVGTGDGSLPYRLAGGHADVLFVGLDPNAEAMTEVARRAGRKPARGGRENVAFVVGAIEEPPPELGSLASAVTVNFPWAGLLEHVLVARENDAAAFSSALAQLAAPDCAAQLLVNEVTDLPSVSAVDPETLGVRLAGPLSAAGFAIEECGWLEAGAWVRSRWGGRLIRGSGRRVVRLRARRGERRALTSLLLDEVGS
jgi:hypothetical protein